MQLKSIGESLTALNSINKVLTNTSLSLESNQVALTAIGKQYSTTTLKAAIAQSQLNKEQIKAILSSNGLQGELLETTADELANAASTNLIAKAQTEATLTTTSLRNAFKGLIASIKGLVTAHPIISTVSIALAAIGSVAYVISDLAKAEKRESDAKLELFEKSKEKVQANQNETKSLNELIEKYKELSSKSNISSDDREEIKEIQNDIIDLVGTEAQRLDLVNGKLENQLNILKNISIEKSKQNVGDAKDNYYNAAYLSDVMVGSADDYGNDVAIKWNDTEAAQIHNIEGFEHIKYDEFIKYIRDNGFGDIFRENHDENIFNLKFVVDTTDIDDLENKVKRLTEFKDFLADNGLTSTGLYQGISSSITQYQTQHNNEIESANILADSVVDNLAKSNDKLAEITIDSLESFEQYRQELLNEVKNDDSVNKALVDGILSNDNLETAVNNFMATGSEFSTWYQQWQDNIDNPTYQNFLYLLHLLQEVQDKGIDLNKTVYGNIDTNNRQVLEWTNDTIEKYRTALESWGETNPDDLLGSHSTVFGMSSEFNEVEIAFSPMLQTENGAVLLNQETVTNYIKALINKACEDDGSWSNEELLQFDIEGLNIDGQQIKGLIADIGDTAIKTGEAMHYTGELGAVNDALKECAESAKNANQTTDEWIDSFVDENDTISTIIDKIKDSLKSTTNEAQNLTSLDFFKSFDKMNKDFQDLTENAELLFSINKQISEIGRVSAENLSKIAEAFPEDKYPEMTKALYEYQLGLISVQDLFAELEVCYENDKNNYIQSLIEKSETDEQYFLLMREKYPQIFEELAEMYGKDVENWKSIAKAKEEIDSILIKSLSNKWEQYFHAIMGSDGKYSLLSTGFDDSDIALTNPGTADKLNQEYTEYQGIAQGFIDDANHALELLDKISYTPTNFNLGDLSWKGLGNSNNSNSSSDSNTAKDYDLIERAIQNLEREISNLDTIANDTFTSWNERNTALLSQINKINEEINTQQAAYEKYMNLANSVGLDSYYQDLIKNGSIDVITITDKNLQNQIDTFQDFYDKAVEAQNSVQELQSHLNELDKTKFDNVVKQFENIQDNISHTINMIDKKLDFIEEKGFFANSSIYENLINQYEKQLHILYDKHDKLTITLNSSNIQEGSQAWNELKQQINEVNESIIDTIISIEQFSNELNKNEFSKFDYFQDKINKLTMESDFYIDLMEAMDKKWVDENGNYTNEGWTNAGLHAQNYNTYLKQAEEYALKIDDINKQLENDPYNTVLLEQKQKYIEAQRESILAAYEEKNAIKDLIKNGYEEQSNRLSKIIDKYKDLLNSMKEAHDYEKNIREQTENLANLNKQYLAVLGDDSEGNRKNIQQLENDIKEAQEELQETQYEKLISDTEKLLDDLQSDYEELMNQRLDDIDTELVNIFNGINENANIIKDTLHQLSIDSDMLLSQEIKDIWNNPQPVIDLNTSVDTVNENISSTNTAIDNLRNVVENILNKMDSIISEKINPIETIDSNNTTYTSTTESSNHTSNYSDYNSNNNSDDSLNSYDHDWWIYKKDSYNKKALNINASVVDRLKSHNYDSSLAARAIYYEKMGLGSSDEFYGSPEQNIKILSWMKKNGYANGTRYIGKRQIAFTQEKGSEMIYDKSTGSMLTPISMEQFIHSLQQKSGTPTYLETGDKVFTNQMSENLWKIAKNPYDFGINIEPDLDYDIPTTTFGNRSNNVKIEFGDVCVSLPNIKNYQEFMQQAQADKNFARMIENIALGKAFGANTFDKFAFR